MDARGMWNEQSLIFLITPRTVPREFSPAVAALQVILAIYT
jgi:hypothetical protein